MSIKYCLPIISPALDQAVSLIERHEHDYHYFEIWLDYIAGVDPGAVRKLAAKWGERLIFVLRRQGLAEPAHSPALRQELLAGLSGHRAYLDLDIKQQAEELSFLSQAGLQVSTILSYHNYEGTPPDAYLHQVLQEMARQRADISKIATLCQNENDALRLLALIPQLKSAGRSFIILGMGEYGKVTRVFGTLWGNQMIFAPQGVENSSAPGQLTRSRLETIFRELGD